MVCAAGNREVFVVTKRGISFAQMPRFVGSEGILSGAVVVGLQLHIGIVGDYIALSRAFLGDCLFQ